MKILQLLIITAALALSSGCGTLDSTGVYGGDKVLYDADLTLSTSYDVLHNFVKWEYDNREVLASTPEIRQYADSIRRQAPQWFASAIALRDAYKGSPNDGTRTALETSLAVIRQALIEATKFYVRVGPAAAAHL